MKIQKIEIEQFGGLSGFKLDLSAGAQYIYGANEAGKSTLCAFIAAMFYGLPQKVRGGGLRGDLRSLYMPWGEKYMAGALYFEADGNEYMLTRRFGQTAKGDKTSLRTGRDWEEVAINPNEIGLRFLGVGEDAFYKTLFIGQLGAVFEKGKEDELLTRLSNLEKTGDEDTSVQKALTELEKAQHELVTKTGRGGSLVQLESEIEDLRAELFAAKQKHAEFKTLLSDIRRMTGEKEADVAALIRLAEQKKQALAFSEYQAFRETALKKEALCTRAQQEKEALAALEARLAELATEREKFSAVLSLEPSVMTDLAEKEATAGVLTKQISEQTEMEQELAALQEMVQAEKAKQGKRKKCLFGVFLAGAVISATLGFLLPVLFVLALVFVAAAVVSLVIQNNKDLIALETRLSEKEASLLRLQQENAAGRLATLTAEISAVFKIAGIENLNELTEKTEAGKALIYQIREAEQEKARLTQSLAAVEAELIALPEVSEKEAVEYAGESPEELDKRREALQNVQLERERELAQMQARAENGFSGTRSLAEIESSLEDARERYRYMQETYETITLAKMALEACAEELKNTFAPVLNQKSGDLISFLTDGRYREVKVTDSYKMTLKRPDGSVEPIPAEYVSAGTYDLLYFALRMAVLQTLQDEIPLLILDDTFMQLDEERQKKAFDWLRENRSQSLYFSCHRPPETWTGQVITL